MSVDTNTFDAIVVGLGISGGWAAKELYENGLKTLVLERGRMVNHPTDYPTMHLDPWDLPNGSKTPARITAKYSKQSRWSFNKTTRHFFNNDEEYDYDDDVIQLY